MKNRPWPLIVLSISYLLIIAFPAPEYLSLGVLDASLYALIAVCGAYLCYQGERWSLICMPFLLSHMLYSSQSSSQTSIALSFLALQLLYLHPRVRKIIKYPTKRYWRTPVRREVNLPSYARSLSGKGFKSQILNISKTGMLIDATNFKEEHNIGDSFELRFPLSPLCIIQCRAKVNRVAQNNNKLLLGLSLYEMPAEARKRIEEYMN